MIFPGESALEEITSAISQRMYNLTTKIYVIHRIEKFKDNLILILQMRQTRLTAKLHQS